MSLFFFLDIKTGMTRPHCYFETNDYSSVDAFDRYLKIRFFPHVMNRISPIFNKTLAIYHPKLKNLDSSILNIKSDFNTFLSY